MHAQSSYPTHSPTQIRVARVLGLRCMTVPLPGRVSRDAAVHFALSLFDAVGAHGLLGDADIGSSEVAECVNSAGVLVETFGAQGDS